MRLIKWLLLPLAIIGLWLASAMTASAEVPCVGGGPTPETVTKPGVVYTTDVHHINVCDNSTMMMFAWVKWTPITADLAMKVTRPDGKWQLVDWNNPPKNYEAYLDFGGLPGGDWTFEVINKSDVPATYNLRIRFTDDPTF